VGAKDGAKVMRDVNGFKQRGEEMTRLETFTDAAFAFAVTLLVVGGGDSVPTNFADLVFAMKQVPAFAASFANIMLFWYAHHVWSRGEADYLEYLLSIEQDIQYQIEYLQALREYHFLKTKLSYLL
jgi:hypothetical protein